jgi:hypothetical protein
MDVTLAEILEYQKALLWVLSFVAGMFFVSTFKGRWFFLFFLSFTLTSSADYAAWQLREGSLPLYNMRCTPGSSVQTLLESRGLTYHPEGAMHNCPEWTPSGDGHYHLRMGSNAYYLGPGGAAPLYGSTIALFYCYLCSGHGRVDIYTITVSESLVPAEIFDVASAGPQTGFYGEVTDSSLVYGEDGYTPVGYTQTQTPPPGVTGVYNPDGSFAGWNEGYFTDDGAWEYKPGYQQLPTDVLQRYYSAFEDWYHMYSVARADTSLTFSQFRDYMLSSGSKFASIENAIVNSPWVKESDFSAARDHLVSSLNAVSASAVSSGQSIVDAVHALGSVSGGGELVPPVVDLSGVESRLDSLRSDFNAKADQILEDGPLPFPPDDVADLVVVAPVDVADVEALLSDWDIGLSGPLANGFNFALTGVFGQVPSCGSSSILIDRSFSIPFTDMSVSIHASTDDYPILSSLRSAVLFILVVYFCLQSWKIISEGMNI